MNLVAIGVCSSVLGLTSAAVAQSVPLEWNVRPQCQPLFSKLETGQVGTLAIVGDSISFWADSYNWFLRDRFWADYGNAGDGYLATGNGFKGYAGKNSPRYGITFSASASGVELPDINSTRDPWGYYTPDGIYARVSGTGFLSLTFYGPSCRLYYLRQPGGGVMRLTLNGVPLVDVPTDGAIAQDWLDFQTGRGPFTKSTLKITSADGAVVQPDAMDMRTGLSGLAYHRLARGSAGPLDFVRSDTPACGALLTNLAPDVLIVMLDWVGNAEKLTFVRDTNQLLDFYGSAMPDTRIVLMTHHPFREEIHDEAVWLYQIAQERNMGFINLFDTFPGGAADMQAMGLLDGDVHLSAAGGEWYGDYVYNLLKHDGTCAPPALEGQPQDQTVFEGDPAGFSVVSANAAGYQWRKDGQSIPGATLDTLAIAAATLGDAGVYDCVLINDCDQTTSAPGVLNVLLNEQKTWWYRDADFDLFGDEATRVFEQEPPQGYVGADGDCNDADAAVHPGAEEVMNGIDDNCDGQIDEGLGSLWYRDLDGDGYGVDDDTVFSVEQPDQYVAGGGDCDDGNPMVNPAAPETLNGVDDDCDGVVDDGFERWWYRDADGDGYGVNEDSIFAVNQPDGYVAEADDCNDNDSQIYLGAPERLNGMDDDCDGFVDDGFESLWYRDADGDGYGDANDTQFVVQQPEGYIALAGDCDDSNAGANPGAQESLNGVDDDCDGLVDDGFESLWYRDADGDGYGTESDTMFVVQQPEGYVAQAGDCDDANAGANPGAEEVFDGADNDCDGDIDENVGFVYYRDADGDGFGNANDSILAGGPPEGYVADASDCDDGDAGVNPLADEVCDGIDNNCDGNTDENAGPVITQDPVGLTAYVGDTVQFSVAQTGGTTYQWRKNGVNINGATGPTYQIVNIKQYNAATYSVIVSNGCGQATSAGAVLTVQTPIAPAAPSGLKGSEPAKGTAALMWTDNADNETFFQVWREKRVGGLWQDGHIVASLPANTVSYAEGPGVGAWRYRVRAGQGNKYSSWTSYAPVAPAQPAGLKAVKVNGAASLSWADISDFEATFTIQRQQSLNGAWQTAVTLPTQGTDTTAMTDSPGAGKYRYRMKAGNAGGSSTWTGWVTITL